MADLTQGAVDVLLRLLTSTIKEEARLLGGVEGDILFIKDEMDSMNGFLLHLTKTETEHNDQHRAWMKQVRDIAYIAQDCIELYKRDLIPADTPFWHPSNIRRLPKLLQTWPKRRRLAKQLHELKDRVREVGERRLRYGVNVPDARPKPEPPVVEDNKEDEKREEFLRALDKADLGRSSSLSSASKTEIISLLLPVGVSRLSEAVEEIGEILDKCETHDLDSKKMLFCALYAYPHVTKEELTSLKKKLMEGTRAVDVSKEVMLLSYSKLSTQYKSCLQYLTAFLEETSISRTILVRRWIAEGLVTGDEGLQATEEAGERCFNELVFRGFVQPADPVVPGLKIKSCYMKESVREFVIRMAQSENFVAGSLPPHLYYQRKIREIARRKPPQEEQLQQKRPSPSWNICPRKQLLVDDGGDTAAEKARHPMFEMKRLLKTLPEEYRLNVLDLGGCSALKDDHLKSIVGKSVLWLKYLSLNNTNVTRLPRGIKKLRRLETLDVRQTRIMDIGTTHVVLPNLKHLLAGLINHETDSLITMQMPPNIIERTRSMEVLRYVILHGKDELEAVGHLKQLRKLGVVLDGNRDNIMHLLRTINNLSECLRSLSVWITAPADTAGDNGGGTILDNKEDILFSLSPPKKLEHLNIKYYFRRRSSGGSLPRWIAGLERLSKITLRDTQLSHSSLRTLGKLESLCCLRLRPGSYAEDSINLESGEFQKLRFLLIDQLTHTIKISFQKDAAPKLEKIVWTFDKEKEEMVIKEDTVSGINYLTSLEELELNGSWNDEGHLVEQALAAHPKHPLLRSNREVSITEG